MFLIMVAVGLNGSAFVTACACRPSQAAVGCCADEGECDCCRSEPFAPAENVCCSQEPNATETTQFGVLERGVESQGGCRCAESRLPLPSETVATAFDSPARTFSPQQAWLLAEQDTVDSKQVLGTGLALLETHAPPDAAFILYCAFLC